MIGVCRKWMGLVNKNIVIIWEVQDHANPVNRISYLTKSTLSDLSIGSGKSPHH